MDYKKLRELLKDQPIDKVQKYVNYIEKLETENDRNGKLKCYWFNSLEKNIEKTAFFFKQVHKEGLEIDGKHVFLKSISWQIMIDYDYIAYKNKLYIVYPETEFTMGVVYEGDDFSSIYENEKIKIYHNMKSAFNHNDDNLKGTYCVIKNSRGEFISTLDRKELAKLRSIAKRDNVWANWFKQMCLKSAIKDVVKYHYNDICQGLLEEDEKQYNLELPFNVKPITKQEIEAINSIDKLSDYYKRNKASIDDIKSFNKLVCIRKEELTVRDKKLKEKNTEMVAQGA